MVEKTNNCFKRITRRLFSRSLNYRADFQLFRCEKMAGASLDTVVNTAFGDQARAGGTQTVDQEVVIKDLESALRFEGDESSHPNLNYLASSQSEDDFSEVISAIRTILDRSHLVLSFQLFSGHPFYPVFWGFAFLIETNEDSVLFIASGSD